MMSRLESRSYSDGLHRSRSYLVRDYRFSRHGIAHDVVFRPR